MNKKRTFFRLDPLALLWTALLSTPLLAQDIDALSLEDLLNADVSTVSRRTQRLSETAAAVFVLTGEEIQRSGVTSLPEALRMVPGVQVARMGNARWAVTARGFNGRYANKLLVLMDGRSIYSPLFSGVIWEQEDTLLEDIDRIEVIRGPGAAMWGANAVNGVINIITKRARATQGGLATASAGSEERYAGAARWGGAIGDATHYRVWAKGLRRDASDDRLDIDESHSARAGFRADGGLTGASRFSMTGEAYRVRAGDRWDRPVFAAQTVASGFVSPTQGTSSHSGANLVGRFDTVLDNGSEAAVQAYVEHSRIDVPFALVDSRDTVDLDFQHRLHRGAHDLMWGLGYRYWRDRIRSTFENFSFTHDRYSASLYSAFIHDEWTLVPERFKLIAGVKAEHNHSTGLEWQPNLRFSWTPSDTRTVWGALSRAVRTPAQAEEHASIDLRAEPPTQSLPLFRRITAVSTGRLDHAEKLSSLELGYRQQVSSALSLDATAYAARYTDLRTGELLGASLDGVVTPAGVIPYLHTTVATTMGLKGRTHGIELALDWHPLEAWRLRAAYTYARQSVHDPRGLGRDIDYDGMTPRHSASIRSSYNLSRNWHFDGWLRHTDKLEGSGIPAYTELDLRVAWRVSPDLELSLVGQNLLDSRHPEWVGDYLPTPTLEVERGWYAKARLTF